MINFLGVKYHSLYILLQIALGTLIGAFYCLRYMETGSLLELFILHFFNNFFSSFISIRDNFKVVEPVTILSILTTVVLYTIVIRSTWNKLQQNPPKSAVFIWLNYFIDEQVQKFIDYKHGQK